MPFSDYQSFKVCDTAPGVICLETLNTLLRPSLYAVIYYEIEADSVINISVNDPDQAQLLYVTASKWEVIYDFFPDNDGEHKFSSEDPESLKRFTETVEFVYNELISPFLLDPHRDWKAQHHV